MALPGGLFSASLAGKGDAELTEQVGVYRALPWNRHAGSVELSLAIAVAVALDDVGVLQKVVETRDAPVMPVPAAAQVLPPVQEPCGHCVAVAAGGAHLVRTLVGGPEEQKPVRYGLHVVPYPRGALVVEEPQLASILRPPIIIEVKDGGHDCLPPGVAVLHVPT
eukprot:CAMPEP_0175291302 /NCGR_PEP_ID=MMETSP0093-20121207/56331_1 /TAXON_ID=311494 /ORGANISM="Alexandrium monilatum, Strain CCMP3105" /LENGTH=164 /DNA_ID=CAMNT_0016587039 /DNA_START=91 /DNA_END=581 /DNA_ORIENTATION=+